MISLDRSELYDLQYEQAFVPNETMLERNRKRLQEWKFAKNDPVKDHGEFFKHKLLAVVADVDESENKKMLKDTFMRELIQDDH